jgi:hypothetical protein
MCQTYRCLFIVFGIVFPQTNTFYGFILIVLGDIVLHMNTNNLFFVKNAYLIKYKNLFMLLFGGFRNTAIFQL